MIKRANPTVVYHGVNIGSGSYPCNVYMELDANGEFVLYEDHLAECDGYMSELADYERTVKRLRKELEEKDANIAKREADAEKWAGIAGQNQKQINKLADEIERLRSELKLAYAIGKQDITIYDAETLLKEDSDVY